METDIRNLARLHAEVAIAVLAEIMTDKDAPAGVRVSAAKAILERGFGKATTQKPEPENRAAPIPQIERVIIDPKEPGVEAPARIDRTESRPYRGIRPTYGWPPASKHPRLGQQVEGQAQHAPPAVREFSDRTMRSGSEWG